MSLKMSFTGPTTGLTSPMVIGDPVAAAGGSVDSVPTLSTVANVPISAVLQINSTVGALALNQLTTTQMNAIVTPYNGMLVYNSTVNAFYGYVNGAWADIAGGGAITPSSIQNGSGIVSLPSYTFAADITTGMWLSAANTLDFSAHGARQLQLVGTAAAVDYLTIAGGATTTNTVTLATAGTDSNISITVTPKGTGAILAGDGAIATPMYSFYQDPQTGMWRSGIGTLDFSCGSVRQFQITDTAVAVNWPSVAGGATTTGLTTGVGVTANGTDANIDVSATPKGTGGLSVRGATNAGSIKLWNQANTFSSSILGAAVASNLTWTWPLTDASVPAGATTTSVPMSSNTAGVLSFSNTSNIYATGTLTSNNILNMYTNGVQLLASPGANFAIIIKQFVLELVGATAYTSGGVVYLQYGNTGHSTNVACIPLPATAVTAASSSNTIASTMGQISNTTTAAPAGVQLAATSVANATISITNATGVFATGTGTANWYIWYSVVPVT